jgi:predicted phage terminase large subunit-like protein
VSAQPNPVTILPSLLPLMTPDEKMYALRLLKARETAGPVPKPVTAEQLVELETNLASFVKAAWIMLQPGRKLSWDWSDDLICEYLTAVRKRQITRLIINVSPRTGKSTKAAVCFPDWVWATEPSHKFLCASYSADLSIEHSVARRHLITSPWYQALWGDKFSLSSDQNQKDNFSNDKRGSMIATSVGGSATGRGGDTAIVDDPLSLDDMQSEAKRKTANNWMDTTLKTRLNDPTTGAIVIIMQRGHELDTTGYLLETEKDTWTHVSIPLEAEKQERIIFPLSGREVLRERETVIQPDRFPPKTIVKMKSNRLVWAGLHQQRPAPLEGNLIKRSDVRYYGGIDPLTGKADEKLPDTFDMVLTSADCSFKDLETSDYVAIGAIGVKARKRFILNVINKQLDVDGTEHAIRRERNEQRDKGRVVSATLVEDKANGPAVIKRLKRNVPGVVEINPMGGKVARMFAVSPEWQAGDWYVDRNAAWTEPFIQQITIFPGAANDDMADMMSQAGIYLQNSQHGVLAFWDELIAKQKAEQSDEDHSRVQADAQKADAGLEKISTNSNLVKPAKSELAGKQTQACPGCGNMALSRFAEGAWKCGNCGATGRDPWEEKKLRK